jgi:hypothetical protein
MRWRRRRRALTEAERRRSLYAYSSAKQVSRMRQDAGSQKQFRDTPRFKFQAVLARTQPFFTSRSVEKQGDQSRFKP